MGDKITMEFEPKDAEMVSAWQRQRNNIQAFAEQIDKVNEAQKHAGKSGESWFTGMSKGMGEMVKQTAQYYTGFQVIERTIDGIVESSKRWSEELDGILEKQREHKNVLLQELALTGKLKQGPEIEEALKKMVIARPEERSAIWSGVNEASPDLTTKQKLAVTKETANLSGPLGEQQLALVGRTAAMISQMDKSQSAHDAVGLALLSAQQAQKSGRAAELGTPESLQALESLRRGGLSTEESLSLQSDVYKHGGGMRELQKLATAMNADMSGDLRMKVPGPDDLARRRIAQIAPGRGRLEALLRDHEAGGIVLGRDVAEKAAHLDLAADMRQAAQWRGSKSGVAQGMTRDWLATNPEEARERGREAEDAADKVREAEKEKTYVESQKDEATNLHRRMGRGGFQNFTIGSWQATNRTMHNLIGVDMNDAIKAAQRANDASDEMVLGPITAKGGGVPLGQGMPSTFHNLLDGSRKFDDLKETNQLLREQGKHLSEQTKHLEQIARQRPQVAVQVHAGGGGHFVDPSRRGEPSASTALGSH